jgi:hypothetical protein
MGVRERDLSYEGAFLSSVAVFEAHLEELFVEFVCGSERPQPGHYCLVEPRNRSVLRSIIHADRGYVDVLPLRRLEKLATRFLNEGKPFAAVADAERSVLASAVRVRHAIAHKSGHAMAIFRDKVPGVDALPPNRRFPGPYLRRVYRAHPAARWIDLYLDTMEIVALRLVVDWTGKRAA